MFRRTSILFLLVQCFAFSSYAQWGSNRAYGPDAGKTSFKRARTIVDTINYVGYVISRHRIPGDELDRYKEPADRDAVQSLRSLQGELDKKDGNAALLAVKNLKHYACDIDFASYEAEAATYVDADRRAKLVADSIKKAKEDNDRNMAAAAEKEKKHYMGMTKEQIVRNFGSLDEYEYGFGIISNSPTKKMVFIDHPTCWIWLLLAYLRDDCGCSLVDDAGNLYTRADDAWITYSGTCNDKPVEIKITRTEGKVEAPATTITITGTAPTLSKLFLGYWENTFVQPARLKKGALISQDFMSDHIIFDWQAADPVVIITSNKKP